MFNRSHLFFPNINAVGETFPRAYFGQGPGRIQLDNVRCRGGENTLLSCNHDTATSEDTHAEDVGVQCFKSGTATTGNIVHQ